MIVDVAGEGLWDMLKALFGQIKYSFLSKDKKIEFNLKQLQKKYWFEQLILESPSLVELIKKDDELKTYLTSRKKLRRLLHNSIERKHFKKKINEKL
ncbi:hypothetical protein [Planococcus salinarum]|uniref:hypothetical protein n=1 Tax=Planococcus salinarum TaxID=622695 RepID=UPI000E3D9A2A|nr:hypothetical protein [Planococcus salinarum]TAA71989.1 hypothetical protein D2909_08270 [Planococcus salinarum]